MKYKYNWDRGNLIICTKEHTIVSVSNENGFGNKKTTIKNGVVVFALENTPNPGSPSNFKIIYKNSFWWANGNFFTIYTKNKDTVI